MIDVFLTHDPSSGPIRRALFQACRQWWLAQAEAKHCRLRIYDASLRPDSQRERHVYAARLATTDTYIVVDDDILPMETADSGQPWHVYATDLMGRQKALGLVGATIHPDPLVRVQSDREVVPARAVGGLRIVRRGAVQSWKLPPLPEGQKTYDLELCEHVEGMCGVTTRWQALHLGWTWPPKPGGDRRRIWEGMGLDRRPSLRRDSGS